MNLLPIPTTVFPLRVIIATLLFLIGPLWVQAQHSTLDEKGLPQNSAFSGSNIDLVNLQNGNLHVSIPFYSETQRGGLRLTWKVMSDSTLWLKKWFPIEDCGGSLCTQTGHYEVQFAGGTSGVGVSEPGGWGITYTDDSVQHPNGVPCEYTGVNYVAYTNWTLIDPEGTSHSLPLRQELGAICHGQMLKGPTMDGSGILYDAVSNTVFLKNGTQITPTRTRDTNGNYASRLDANSNASSGLMDSNGRTPVVVTQGPNVPPGSFGQGQPQYTDYTVRDSSGSPQIYRAVFSTVEIRSNACSWGVVPNASLTFPCNEGDVSGRSISKLILPNGTFYQFTYTNGDLSRIDLPTGSSISYTHTDLFEQRDSGDKAGQPNYYGGHAVSQRILSADGVDRVWTYSAGSVTDPLGNVEAHAYKNIVNAGAFQRSSASQFDYQTKYTDAAGKLWKTVTTDYDADYDPVNDSTANVRPIRVTTTLDDGQSSKRETDYDSFTYPCNLCQDGNLTATRMNPVVIRDFDYQNSYATRITNYEYLHTSNPDYQNLNIVDRATKISVQGGSTTVYEYDEYGHAGQGFSSSGAVQHDPGYSTANTLRGNLTAISRWRDTDSTYLTTTMAYDDSGNVTSQIDPRGNKTNYDYTDHWSGSSCGANGRVTAFRTATTNSLGQVSAATYNACSGLVDTTTDANSQVTAFVYDAMSRPTKVVNPDGGGKTICYSDTPGTACSSTSTLSVVQIEAIDTLRSRTTTTIFNSLGLLRQTQLTDPRGTVYSDTEYDLLSRVHRTTAPYRSGDTLSWTTADYDGLGRTTLLTFPDQSQSHTTYVGNTVTMTDEAGHARATQSNAFGEITSVWEDPYGLNAKTDYSFDGAGNLKVVAQVGVPGDATRNRTFVYDSLAQLQSSSNPETGTILYSNYDSNGNVGKKTDARGISVSYTYDALNRLSSRAKNGVLIDQYFYDGAVGVWAGVGFEGPSPNVVGRLSFIRSFNPSVVARCDL